MSDDRIAELEATVAGLESRLRALGALPPLWHAPSDEEIDALISLVVGAYPNLAPREIGYRVQFVNSLHALAYMRRRSDGRLNRDYGVQWFTDEASHFCKHYGIRGNVGLHAFCAAVICDRVPFSGVFPFVEVALEIGGTSKPMSLWRQTLSDGLLAPSPPRRPPTRLPQQGTIVVRPGDDRLQQTW